MRQDEARSAAINVALLIGVLLGSMLAFAYLLQAGSLASP
jgi:hypothetical protein